MKGDPLWEDTRPPYRGRRGRVAFTDPTHVTLDPAPGSCPCPLKQRRTRIRLDRFFAAWVRIEEQP